eukprot:CAMPEP_0194318754 /NCGR_PEP_ID=MMETSP0171-20130528/15309_1 /TAXON_ID=218684 /ORGANISM="Corethron pennatum, Strain L29A3" /LENGTH=728 /DNA_ID=CAMNT_0039075749 /DNA_START=43 /DNA_END=2226 /DNA_ORIENTATION=+
MNTSNSATPGVLGKIRFGRSRPLTSFSSNAKSKSHADRTFSPIRNRSFANRKKNSHPSDSSNLTVSNKDEEREPPAAHKSGGKAFTGLGLRHSRSALTSFKPHVKTKQHRIPPYSPTRRRSDIRYNHSSNQRCLSPSVDNSNYCVSNQIEDREPEVDQRSQVTRTSSTRSKRSSLTKRSPKRFPSPKKRGLGGFRNDTPAAMLPVETPVRKEQQQSQNLKIDTSTTSLSDAELFRGMGPVDVDEFICAPYPKSKTDNTVAEELPQISETGVTNDPDSLVDTSTPVTLSAQPVANVTADSKADNKADELSDLIAQEKKQDQANPNPKQLPPQEVLPSQVPKEQSNPSTSTSTSSLDTFSCSSSKLSTISRQSKHRESLPAKHTTTSCRSLSPSTLSHKSKRSSTSSKHLHPSDSKTIKTLVTKLCDIVEKADAENGPISEFQGALASILSFPDRLADSYFFLRSHPFHQTQLRSGSISEAARHPDLCRYVDCYPQDSHLLRIPADASDDDGGGTFLNASLVSMPDGPYIAAAGPMAPGWHGPDTRTRFWAAVWHHDVRLVVALAPPERGAGGCSEYATDGCYGDFKLEVVEETFVLDGDAVQRKIRIGSGGWNYKEVTHLEYLKWPNYGFPRNDKIASLALHTLEVMGRSTSEQSNASLVHCCGGIGRTGTFISILSMWNRRGSLRTEEDVMFGVIECVERLRTQRHPYCVEGEAQWEIIFRALAAMSE